MGSTLTTAFIFVLILNVLFVSAQASIININPNSNMICGIDNTLLESYTTGDILNENTTIDSNSFSSSLPDSVADADESSGYGFLDTIASVKNWITGKAEIFVSLAAAPNNFIRCIPGIPNVWTTIISAMWYSISFFLLIAFIFGRSA